MSSLETQVLIIGGGVTGTGLARDLALRGVQSIVVEKGDINAGASGANHGLLHSGARYVSTDPATAIECRKEGKLLKRLASHCIEETGGLFAAVEGDDENYAADFPHLCSRCGISVQTLDAKEARELEPALSEKVIAAYLVEDAFINPFQLSLENISHARRLGTTLLLHTKVIDFTRSDKHIQAVRLLNTKTGEQTTVEAEQVVNAAGAWAGEVAALAGAPIAMLYSKGSILVTQTRLAKRVVSRLRLPSDGDILAPAGTVSLLGTTSVRTDSPGDIRPTMEEANLLVDEGAALIPVLKGARYIRAFAGVRPLVGTQTNGGDRSVSRGLVLLDHARNGLENFTTITGGKLSTFRLMAEKAADLVCRRLGVSNSCLTRTEPLPSTEACRWSEPGVAPRLWMKQPDPEDTLLCECEMVPRSVIDGIIASIHEHKGKPDLKTIGLRSRIGKGPCQGTFCGARVTAHMYERGELHLNQGLTNLKDFLRERWKGERPVARDVQLSQAALKEAFYCGLCCLELEASEKVRLFGKRPERSS